MRNNTVRKMAVNAMVAALTLNLFNKHADRVRMANIAQIANVLQSMILTREDKMVLTPTYYIFKMYKVHQDATYVPLDIACERRVVREDRIVPTLSATASRDAEGILHLSLANIDLNEPCEVEVSLDGIKAKSVTGEILTSSRIDDYNTFDEPNKIATKAFDKARISKGKLMVTIPAKSIVTLTLE